MKADECLLTDVIGLVPCAKHADDGRGDDGFMALDEAPKGVVVTMPGPGQKLRIGGGVVHG